MSNSYTINNTTVPQARAHQQVRTLLLALYPDLTGILLDTDLIEQHPGRDAVYIITEVGQIGIIDGQLSIEYLPVETIRS